jgi:ElaB/YqjD/DUF883 family membrane-anchored ribosome-binding protein
MALPAEETNYRDYPEAQAGPAELVEMPVAVELVACSTLENEPGTQEAGTEEPGVQQRVHEYATRATQAASQALNTATETASQALNTATDAARQSLNTATEAASEALNTTRESTRRIYQQARTRAKVGYSHLSESSREWVGITKRSAKLVKRDYPLQTLGAIAGAAFLCGMALRIWRARNS